MNASHTSCVVSIGRNHCRTVWQPGDEWGGAGYEVGWTTIRDATANVVCVVMHRTPHQLASTVASLSMLVERARTGTQRQLQTTGFALLLSYSERFSTLETVAGTHPILDG